MINTDWTGPIKSNLDLAQVPHHLGEELGHVTTQETGEAQEGINSIQHNSNERINYDSKGPGRDHEV